MALLDLSEPASVTEGICQPQVALLGSGVVLIIWDVPETVRAPASLSIADGVVISPTASLRLERKDGGTRLLWALRRPDQMNLQIGLTTGTLGSSAELNLSTETPVPPLDVRGLLGDLAEQAIAILASTLINLWSGLFRLQRNSLFVRHVVALLRLSNPSPQPALVAARGIDDLILVQTPFPDSFDRINAVYRIGSRGIERLKGQPHRASVGKGRAVLHFLAEGNAENEQAAWLVFAGADGLQARVLTYPEKRAPNLTSWLRDHTKRAAGLREHLLIELSQLTEKGRSASVEAQLGAPLERQRVSTGPAGLAAEITCALSTSAGTLVAGWLRDPLNLVAGIAAVGRDGTVHELTDGVRQYPITIEALGGGGRLNATGFAALAPSNGGDTPILQPRFRLLLKSGAYHPLVPAPQPFDAAEARAAALRAVPPQHVDEPLLAEILSPVIGDLHRRVLVQESQPKLRQIGEALPRPRVSVIIPLYKALDFLRFQIAAFATDPWFRKNAELIYVLDSPEQAAEVEHLLQGLHLVYELPLLLAIMDRNSGYARACNVGASLARGEVLALVNSDIIPVSRNWLAELTLRLDRRKRIGAVGPKLLFEDGSLQHAGMFFEKDHHGRWLNHHYFKGMPRHYAPATEERLVPAVTGACLVTSRDLFEKIGGFSEDYVIGDYEDSDLCLKINAADQKILYTPEVELYHLERKSMSLNLDYMKGVAWQYNCALHASRWEAMMTRIMSTHSRVGRTRSKAA
ncbi:glycosyltransferase [Microvirga puerhi]|uniref:Glycosyltransferase n=1 Tax=Microvirga puerhi TaxID=2876078 RepID=A0ABS7VJF2_9HYPH|nr:glycosyltransferase [Microvirga puerhi]MBZ6075157.1 glycosyltransferase [Microvirga puerhi]